MEVGLFGSAPQLEFGPPPGVADQKLQGRRKVPNAAWSGLLPLSGIALAKTGAAGSNPAPSASLPAVTLVVPTASQTQIALSR